MSEFRFKDGYLFLKVKENIRIKDYLRSLKIFSNNLIHRLIKQRAISFTDGSKIGKNRLLGTDDEIKVFLEDCETSDYVPIDGSVDILYEDDLFLIINKQPDEILFFTASKNRPCIASYVQYYFNKNNIISKIRFVNRLDRDTSGILVIAKNSFAHNFIFNNHTKTYYAVTFDYYRTSGVISHRLIRRMPYTYVCENEGKESVTRFRKVCSKNGFSLIACKLLTGRTHQIRVHMAFEGFPLIGDKGYGGVMIDGVKRQLLHCGNISFFHPFKKKRIKIRAPFPEEFMIKS